MKKLLTLMGLGAFALAANAITPGTAIDLSDFQLDPSYQLKVQKIEKQNLADIQSDIVRKGVIKKTYTNGNNVWDIWVLNNNARWCDILQYQDGSKPTFENMPFYYVTLYVLGYKADDPQHNYVTAVSWPLLWPSTCMWDYTAFQEGVDFNTLDHKIVDLDLLANNGDYCRSFLYNGLGTRWETNAEGTMITYWPVGLPSWFGNTTARIDGQDYNYPTATQNGTTVTPASATSTFDFKSYEASEKFLEIDATIQLLPANSTQAVRRVVQYTGKARVEGFAPARFNGKFGAVHMVNLDTQSADINFDKGWSDPFDFEDWGPYQKYYVFAVSPDYKIIDESADYNEDKFGYGKSLFLTEADGVTEVKDQFFIYGNILNQSSTENPQNFNKVYRWIQAREVPSPYEPNTTTLTWDWWTDFGQVLPDGYNDQVFKWSSEEWAMLCGADGYRTILEYPSVLNIGTKDGFELYAHDNFGNIYDRTFTGKIVYHPDRNKMSQTVEIDAVGDLVNVEGIQATEEAGIFAGNGEIRVVANTDTEVAVYALSGAVVAQKSLKAGETVVVPVEKGIYVVKAGNGAKKVAL